MIETTSVVVGDLDATVRSPSGQRSGSPAAAAHRSLLDGIRYVPM